MLSATWHDPETRLELGYDWRLDTDLPRWYEYDWQPTTFRFQQGFLPDLIDSPVDVLRQALDHITSRVAIFLSGIEYLGPIRPKPQRVYLLGEIVRQRWRQEGWGAYVDLLEGKLDDAKLIEIDEWLQTLGLGEQIMPPTNKFANRNATVASVEIEEQQESELNELKLQINLNNTGFGASQVIPILVHAVTADQRTREGYPVCIVIEQPELHLHPRAQARLADLFITMANQNVQFILETHSDAILLRLQRRIVESTAGLLEETKSIDEDDLSTFCIQRETDVSTVAAVRFSELGDLQDVPPCFDGFFSNDRDETAELLRAQLLVKMRG